MARVKQQVSLLFLDVKGYSQLRSDRQFEIFFEIALQGMSEEVKKHGPLYTNSWGDAILAVFDNQIKAARCALDIRDYFRKTNWESVGLDEALNPRIALHTGSVFFGHDPIQGRDGIAGHNVNLAARIEPVTPPGEVWASDSFAVSLREELNAERDKTIILYLVGPTDLAKKWGIRELYCIRRSLEPTYRPVQLQDSLKQIEGSLLLVAQELSCISCSILVLDKKSENKYFFFLCAFGPNSEKVRQLRIPSNKGIAGFVARTKLPYISNNLHQDKKFAPNVAQKANIETTSMLTVPILEHGEDLIGVVQFVNKQNGEFTKADEKTALEFASNLAPSLTDIVEHKLASEAPLVYYQGIRECTVVFTDLTNYRQIASQFELPIVTNLLNEYLTKVCQVALDHGCWIDKFLGDGVMIVTNTPQEVPEYCLAAVKLAAEIEKKVQELIGDWLRFELPVNSVKSRIGIATGEVYLGNMGHPKINWYTAVGSSVNLAWRLLEAGDRDSHCILICPRSYQLVEDYVEADPVEVPYKEPSIQPGVAYKLRRVLGAAV